MDIVSVLRCLRMSSISMIPCCVEKCHWQSTGKVRMSHQRIRGNRVGTVVSQKVFPSGSSQACNSQDLGHKGQIMVNKHATWLGGWICLSWLHSFGLGRGGICPETATHQMSLYSQQVSVGHQSVRNFFSNQRPERRLSSNNWSSQVQMRRKNPPPGQIAVLLATNLVWDLWRGQMLTIATTYQKENVCIRSQMCSLTWLW